MDSTPEIVCFLCGFADLLCIMYDCWLSLLLAFFQLQDLIEMVVNLQHSVEKQAKVQSDLEDYIDSLLSKVISKAPDILQKNAEMNARFGTTVK